jgi:hypothetical protein
MPKRAIARKFLQINAIRFCGSNFIASDCLLCLTPLHRLLQYIYIPVSKKDPLNLEPHQ